MENDVSLRAQLLELEERLLKTEVRTSPEELSLLLADDFFEFGSSGDIWYKSNGVAEEGIGAVKMILSNFEIHPLSNESVLTTYRIFNEVKMQHTLRSSIWRYRDGRWKMFFHQGTPSKHC
ncbi:nuclear transport factor 2 family protein [Paenibacillus eucommiae]|uniref:DUF4440 domain-containing protein n=1 Tax=Paenibacillus eucommiae TaxID=1355755 RepID=A0ABS4J2H9_9BACL|nr:DUF4440 domain-containing protein [Paenibacillus eucommiae]MBP1993014.1 hypothetical protein [Paenibacillus eucommiae]